MLDDIDSLKQGLLGVSDTEEEEVDDEREANRRGSSDDR